jgi:hypothetical protein
MVRVRARVAGALVMKRLWRLLHRLPIRWRLAGTSALLTLFILCVFALFIGRLTGDRIRSDFEHQTAAAADDLRDRLVIEVDESGRVAGVVPNLDLYAAGQHAVIRVLALDGTPIAQTASAPNLGLTFLAHEKVHGYLVETRARDLRLGGKVLVQYARPASDMEATISHVRLLLVLGVLGGTACALLAGLMIARRAMAPIAQLTSAASTVARTRDPGRDPPARGQRRGGRAGPHPGGDAPGPGRSPGRNREHAGPPAPVRGRRLTRAAHPADQRAGQPRAAGRVAPG